MKNQNNPQSHLRDYDIGFFQKNNSISTIYIGNLRYSKKQKDLKQLFEKYGEVSYVRLVMDKETRKSKGYAFIQMPDRKSASKAIQSLNGQQMDGRTLKVSMAKETAEASNSTRKPKFNDKKVKKATEAKSEVKKAVTKKTTGLNALFEYLNNR
jgi:RNA recognition motif-containing protein